MTPPQAGRLLEIVEHLKSAWQATDASGLPFLQHLIEIAMREAVKEIDTEMERRDRQTSPASERRYGGQFAARRSRRARMQHHRS